MCFTDMSEELIDTQSTFSATDQRITNIGKQILENKYLYEYVLGNEPLRLIPALRMRFEKGSLQEPVVVGIQWFYAFQVPNFTLMHIP